MLWGVVWLDPGKRMTIGFNGRSDPSVVVSPASTWKATKPPLPTRAAPTTSPRPLMPLICVSRPLIRGKISTSPPDLSTPFQEVLVEQRANDNSGVGNAVQPLIFSLIRCSEIDLGEFSALPPEIASHYNQGVVDCKRPADERGRRINDLQLSGVMEQKSMEYLRTGFKRTHHVSPIV